jgi:hypothetical protein
MIAFYDNAPEPGSIEAKAGPVRLSELLPHLLNRLAEQASDSRGVQPMRTVNLTIVTASAEGMTDSYDLV